MIYTVRNQNKTLFKTKEGEYKFDELINKDNPLEGLKSEVVNFYTIDQAVNFISDNKELFKGEDMIIILPTESPRSEIIKVIFK